MSETREPLEPDDPGSIRCTSRWGLIVLNGKSLKGVKPGSDTIRAYLPLLMGKPPL